MINLAWKLALVLKGQAPAALLDTYEQDRLPVIRNVLSRTEGLTGIIGSERPVVRNLFNHLGPWVGGAGVVQETAAARMSQIALGYRGSPLSANHAHGGRLRAGDRVPDLPVRYRNGNGDFWTDHTLFGLLDPSRFVLLVVHPAEASAVATGPRDAVRPWADIIRVVELAPLADDAARARFQRLFGRSDVFLVRPDGYVGLAGGQHAGPQRLDTYCRRWLTTGEPTHAG
jgi:hypothetical protein